MNVLWLSSLTQYNNLVSTGSIIINGVTYTYDPLHTFYLVPSQDIEELFANDFKAKGKSAEYYDGINFDYDGTDVTIDYTK